MGNSHEANEELEKIPPRLRAHPDVLTVRYQIYSSAGNWSTCLDIGTAMTKLDPDNPLSWVARATALGELGRIAGARNVLLSVARKFENEASILYELAQFSCLLGKVAEARAWLGKSFESLTDPEANRIVRLRALEDPDLAEVWREGGDLK